MTSPEDDRAVLEQLSRENARLRRAVEELSILNDLARSIGASVNAKEIMNKIINRALKAVGGEQGVIALGARRPKNSVKTVARAMVTSGEGQPLHMNQSLLGWMYLHRKPLLVNDLKNDGRFKDLEAGESISSILCVPLMVKSEVRGILAVYNKKGGARFTQEDERLVAILAGQSAQVVENAQLYEEQQALLKLREEVRLVSQIQVELLPRRSPDIPGYDVAGRNVPATMVGGDYFDFIHVDEHKFCVCLGDVSGKGLPASLLMANLQATLRGQAHRDVVPNECVYRCNNMLFRSTNPEHFVTLFCGLLDAAEHRITFCNAGHDFPILLSKEGLTVRLQTGGVVLGVIENYKFEQETVELAPGDLLVIYSDGITEAMDSSEIEFGEDRLHELIAAHRDDPAEGLIDRTFNEVGKHTRDHPQSDDMTMVVVRRTEG